MLLPAPSRDFPPGRPPARGVAAFVAGALALALPAAAVVGAATAAPGRHRAPRATRLEPDYESPTARWREGPVRYLLSKQEDEAFRALSSDEERATFIQRFWAGRDPQASTPENEYRALFYRRVSEADRLFTESTKPGWKTDRGKIYILLGPPDDLDQAGFPSGRSADVIRWTYRDAPAGTGIGSNTSIRFVRDRSGEYRLVSGVGASLGTSFLLQRMQMKSLPEPRELLDTVVGSNDFLDAAPFRTHHDFFRAGDGNTFAVVTLGVKNGFVREPARSGAGPALEEADGTAGGGSRFEVMARLVGDAPGLPTYDLAGPTGLRPGDQSGPSGADDYRFYQAGTSVKPGRYTIYYGLVDHGTTRIDSFKESLTVPDLTSVALSLSGITLASHLEWQSGAWPPPPYSAPFVLGGLKAVPRADDTFRNDEDLAFYYSIYGSETDPIDGRPDLDVEYLFYSAGAASTAGEPSFAPLGKPIHLTRQQSLVQGYSLSLKDWSRATYRLRVQVIDNLTGRQAEGEVTFRVL
ncbi:MAG TPA: GWxTD domain-containing protein [Candidatus Polarisedimenticolia bacterium]|nr:GWxTD domain-containing protein [Candidatus Polarisedimenticolia bacterium]